MSLREPPPPDCSDPKFHPAMCKCFPDDEECDYECHLCGHGLIAPWERCPGCGAGMGDKRID